MVLKNDYLKRPQTGVPERGVVLACSIRSSSPRSLSASLLFRVSVAGCQRVGCKALVCRC